MAMDTKKVRNLVLLGKTGNGKSSTGNSILDLVSPKPRRPPPPDDKMGFKAATGAAGVTQTTQMKSGKVHGYDINVIDTPGLFDTALSHEYVSKEIVNCMQKATGGVHAFIGVLKTDRFSDEEAKAFDVLVDMFGTKALDYMIIVFTTRSPDIQDMEDLEDFLIDAPKSLMNILDKCKHRKVLFDNVTKDEYIKKRQVSDLIALVSQVVGQNHGQPYTNELIEKLKQEEIRRKEVEKEMAAAKARQEIAKAEEMRRKIEKETRAYYEQHARETKAQLQDAMIRQKSQECCSVM